jgi:hypothetical protein
MMTPTRIVRLVGIAGLLGWLAMVSWMAKTTWAQNGAQAPQPPPAQSELAPPRAEQATASGPPPITPEGAKAPAGELSVTPANLPPPAIPGDVAPSSSSAPVSPYAASPPTVAQEPAAGAGEDPEKSAQSFVERNQKEAEEHLKALTAEAEQLRARLTRLESGIRRWQVLVNALRSAQGVAATDDPSALEPVPQTAPAGARKDKRVKWASANPAPAPATEAPPTQPAVATELAPDPAPAPASAPVARPMQPVAPGVAPR